jgi:hypothetical protein
MLISPTSPIIKTLNKFPLFLQKVLQLKQEMGRLEGVIKDLVWR